MRAYLDTSAAGKLLIDEAESEPLASWLDRGDAELAAGFLVETELRRLATRFALPQADVTTLLDGVSLYDTPPSLFREAGLLPGRSLRALGALHLAAAIRIDCEAILTYDDRLADAAAGVGMKVLAPRR